jgi:chemosensory pili system protein ChpE
MATLFLTSMALGIAFSAPPGVITAEAIRRGLARGFRPALFVELGSLIGDATWAIIALAGIAFIVQNALARLILGVMGTLFMLYLAWSALRDAKEGGLPRSNGATARGDFAAGAFLALGNPFNIAFWLGIGGSAIAAGVPNPQTIHLVVWLAAFLLGALVWCFILSGLIGWGHHFITPTFFRVVNFACGLFLSYFGLQLLWNIVQGVV